MNRRRLGPDRPLGLILTLPLTLVLSLGHRAGARKPPNENYTRQ